MSVTITALEAENVKRIKAVEITPAPTGLTLVGGNNNQGKTSVLDALAWALGGDKFRPAAAARDGAITPPHLKVTLSNGIVVERRGKNSTLTVTDPTGRRAGQQLLNEFVEVLALDLPRFMDASDRDKADTLLKIIGVGEQLAALDQRIKALYDKRTAVGQIAQQKKAYAEEMLSYPEAPAEPVSALELIQQQQEILLRNAENQRQRDRLAEVTHAKHLYADELQRLDERIEALQAQRRELKASYDAAVVAEEAATKTVAQLQDESTAALEESIRNVEDTNRKVRANLDKARAEDDAAEMAAQYSKLTDQINRVARENLTGINVVHAFNAEQYQNDKFNKPSLDMMNVQVKNQKLFALVQPTMTLGMNGLALTIYWLGAALVNNIALTDSAARLTMFSDVLVFSTYATYVVMSFMMLVMIFMLLPQAQVSAERINEVLERKANIREGSVSECKEHGTVEFKNVSFRYPHTSEDELSSISFRVNRGETLAVIGATGSGKTTLVSLIPRFYDATEGEVLVDGVNVRDYTFDTLYNKLGYVTQKAVLFAGSIRDNVYFGESKRRDGGDTSRPAAPSASAPAHRGSYGGYDNVPQGGSAFSELDDDDGDLPF